jgi:hypothetical protein
MISSLVLGSVVFCVLFGQPPPAAAQVPAAARAATATADEPFQFYVITGATGDDNLFRLADEAQGEALLGTGDLSDRYRSLGLGFDSLMAREHHRFELRGDVNRQTYDEFTDFDHTAGRLRGAWNWKASDATQGDLGYRYRRELRSFANQDIPSPDIITENTLFASIERQLKQRWLLRFGGESADLQFSTSPLLQKQRSSLEAELRYAASQSSSFGLLTTFTKSKFDENRAQDFSGWSVGPVVRWQPKAKLTLTANAGYTHQELEELQPDIRAFEGITGNVAAEWRPSTRLSWKLRAYRDISDLGGEIPLYTELSGASLQPSWQITENLASRAQLEYQTRDFIRSSVMGIRRKDDYRLAELWFDLTVARRWLISVGLGTERRDSNVDGRNFDDMTVNTTIRFDL